MSTSASPVQGLLAYAAYVPRHRLQRSELAAALGTGGGKGARTVASYDEDATTMAVAAARRVLTGEAQQLGSIYFATTAPPYMDKTNASAIHAALGLGHEGFAVDLAGSARGAAGALRAAAATGGLAVMADVRTGKPGSADERDGGDGAAAFAFGSHRPPIAELLSQASSTAEFLDRWRVPGESFSSVWEERFGLEAYLPLIEDAAGRALAEAGVEQADHVVVSSPSTRTAATAAKRFAGRVDADPAATGYAGAADAGLALAAALDRAAPGETVLVISAADGCDAFVFRTTAELPKHRAADSVQAQLTEGRDVLYATFLAWRGVLDRETPRRPEPDRPAAPPSARSEAWKFGFIGSRCTDCGRVHVPPTRVCSKCHSVDRMEPVPLAGRLGTVVTYTVDRLAYSPSPPMIDAVVDFDGGGRYTLEVTDARPEQVDIGARVEMTFRRLYTSGGVHNYFWKARPLSNGE
jgi:hydroxymethylglutaryl-CoA synthase